MLPLQELLQEPVVSVIEREQSELERLIQQSHGQIVLFGAGNLGRRALAKLRSIGIEPLCFCDNNQRNWGSSIDGCKVLSPNEGTARFGADALFVVTIWNATHWYVETLKQLRNLGCKSVSTYSPVYWRFAEVFLPYLLNDYPHKVYEHAKDVLAADSVWSDLTSLETYRSHVTWYATGDASHLPGRPDENSYFPADIFSISPLEVFVDCGAFDGDTIRQLMDRTGNSFQAIHAIEADPLSLEKLDAALCLIPQDSRRKIHVYPCAVGAERTLV